MKLPAAYATDVYINNGGYLSIAQNTPEDGDVIVALSRDQARLVAAEIMRLDADGSAWAADDGEADQDE